MPHRTTMKDIATAARTSIATVSLALSGARRVAPDTHRRIIRTAERLGYIPLTKRVVPTDVNPDSGSPVADLHGTGHGNAFDADQFDIRRVVMKDIAEAAGVSISTVSLALAGDARVAAPTRRHIVRIVDRLGYVPNPVLSGLASNHFRHTGKSIAVGVLTDRPGSNGLLAQQICSMGMALREVARADPAVLKARIDQLQIAALVVTSRGLDPGFLASLTLPVVQWVDDDPGNLTFDVIEISDWWSTLTTTLMQVRTRGYKHPVFIHIPAVPRHWHDDVRLAAARHHGIPVCETACADTRALAEFLRKHKPDAVIGLVPIVRELLADLGHHLPVACMILTDGHWSHGLAGMRPDFSHRCRATCEIIEHRLRFGPRPPRRVILPPRWQNGASLPAASHGG